jgi:hypothetical protein
VARRVDAAGAAGAQVEGDDVDAAHEQARLERARTELAVEEYRAQYR